MAQVILKDVDKVYEGNVKVVDGFNLEIRDGEFILTNAIRCRARGARQYTSSPW
jgi:hypothetical protein